MKTRILTTLITLACAAISFTPALAEGAEPALIERGPDLLGFHSCNVGDPDWMLPRLNLVFRVPDRLWDPTVGTEANALLNREALARFFAQINDVIAVASDMSTRPSLNIFVYFGGHPTRLPDCDWEEYCRSIIDPPDTNPNGPNIPEPFLASALLGVGVGATTLIRRVRHRRTRA